MPPNAGNAVLVASHGYWPPDAMPLLERIAEAGMGVYWLPVDAATKPPAITGIPERAIRAALRSLSRAPCLRTPGTGSCSMPTGSAQQLRPQTRAEKPRCSSPCPTAVPYG